MLFSSPVFLFLFLPVTLVLYACAPRSTKNAVLLVASLIFYAWGELEYAGVLLLSIIVNYAMGVWIDRTQTSHRSHLVSLGVAANLAVLIVFKYAGFLSANASTGLNAIGIETVPFAPLPLPLGISFFTFQGISYLIDVGRRDVPAQRRLIDLSLYIAMFPQLIAGPIVRYGEISAALASRRHTLANVDAGLRRFVSGLARKMLLANPLGETADTILASAPGELSMGAAWLGITCYAFQIYFDFSGYSDMAIGLGRIFGFRIPENFHYPYTATSIRDFWRRWHITLSSWFRDYLYIPLGGNRLSASRTTLHLLLVFFLCGLWHGASWNFVFWGLFHGALLGAERLGLERVLKRSWLPIRHAYVLLSVWIGWVVFRVEDGGAALLHIKSMFGLGSGVIGLTPFLEPRTILCLILATLFSTSLPSALWLELQAILNRSLVGRGTCAALRLTTVLCLGLLCAATVVASAYNPFIYFRF